MATTKKGSQNREEPTAIQALESEIEYYDLPTWSNLRETYSFESISQINMCPMVLKNQKKFSKNKSIGGSPVSNQSQNYGYK